MYGRKPISNSHGRTHDRIMAMQRADDVLPGAEHLLVDTPDDSLAAAIVAFHREHVVGKHVVVRRTFERSMVLLLRDFAENGPDLNRPVDRTTVTLDRLLDHLHWRARLGLAHGSELQRTAVQLSHLATWLDEHRGTSIGESRDALRDRAAQLAVAPVATPPGSDPPDPRHGR